MSNYIKYCLIILIQFLTPITLPFWSKSSNLRGSIPNNFAASVVWIYIVHKNYLASDMLILLFNGVKTVDVIYYQLLDSIFVLVKAIKQKRDPVRYTEIV
ncbi:MAG: hypothetical protein QNJ70_25155 [Xenococcaceae cyanobacterium MO_207.B15]|nr:hypothetical protein [Xenococcaceae cyanobacterium MO_207.B15]